MTASMSLPVRKERERRAGRRAEQGRDESTIVGEAADLMSDLVVELDGVNHKVLPGLQQAQAHVGAEVEETSQQREFSSHVVEAWSYLDQALQVSPPSSSSSSSSLSQRSSLTYCCHGGVSDQWTSFSRI